MLTSRRFILGGGVFFMLSLLQRRYGDGDTWPKSFAGAFLAALIWTVLFSVFMTRWQRRHPGAGADQNLTWRQRVVTNWTSERHRPIMWFGFVMVWTAFLTLAIVLAVVSRSIADMVYAVVFAGFLEATVTQAWRTRNLS
jgi:ABC-type Fe3+ transport system permease subunit